ncbi:hypothetical protein [Primorskyibacter sp. S87]|uniref:hypothetical protein n=1 Tax=Primorskyibacter sp. S87 TaxID=3415126 RepID=UPI003C7AEE50
MTTIEPATSASLSPDTTQEKFSQLIAEASPLVTVIELETLKAVVLPSGSSVERPFLFGDHLALLQPDGTVILLEDVAGKSLLVQVEGRNVPLVRLIEVAAPEGSWPTLADVPTIPLHFIFNPGAAEPGSGGGEGVDVLDPLEGLVYNPLLPPTGYTFPVQDDWPYGGSNKDGSAPSDFDIVINGPIRLTETDSTLDLHPADYITINIPMPETGEEVTQVDLELARLPLGTLTSHGTLVPDGNGTLTLEFSGSYADFLALSLTLPQDFSSQSRLDAPTGPLPGNVEVWTNFQGYQQEPFVTIVAVEGDASVPSGETDLVETDAPVTFRPSDTVLPKSTDIDGSEHIQQVAIAFVGLPAGALYSSDNGTTFQAAPSDLIFRGTLAEYQALVIQLPTDFSTENPVTRIFAQVTAITNEGGLDFGRLDVVVDYELDVTLTAPAELRAEEDSNGGDGSGATINMQISVAATDIDGSEDSTTVEIAFVNVPRGTIFSGGSYNISTSIWKGSMTEAGSLTLTFPGDFSGTVEATIRALSPEGTVETKQTIIIEGTGDVNFDVSELTAAETDARVEVNPSSTWKVVITDFDPNPPGEMVETITLTLGGLPPDVQALGVPASTISYDATSGGTLIFTGTEAQYQSLRLSFPTDYSTESPDSDGLILTGTLAATSTEDPVGADTPVELRITPEGDVVIDTSLPDTVPDETDAPTPLVPSNLLAPTVTDMDGSEALDSLVLTITGLPGSATLADLGLDPLPAGATHTLGNDPATGASTLVITLDAAAVGDVLATYNALALSLATDFSTANRNDLTNGTTSLPIVLTVQVQTDEDQDPASDTPVDGTAIASRQVDIGFELDVDLSAPADLTGDEDSASPGVVVDLGIIVAATDIDGSEDSTTIEITYTGLPIGVTFNGGSFDPATGIWTGSMVEANALMLSLPEDYSGTINSTIKAISPEGTTTTSQRIVIFPTGDIVFDAVELVEQETDAALAITPSSAWKVSVDDTDGSERIDTITLTLADLPSGVVVRGVPRSTVTYDQTAGGDFTFAGTEAQYLALELLFPRDYSTESPAADGMTLSGTLAATSNEDATGGSTPITLRITPEGDVMVDDTLPDTVPDETDAPTPVTPSSLLLPRVLDLDGSESLETLVLTIAGLPSGSSAGNLNLVSPPGAGTTFTADILTGSDTLTISLDTAAVGDVLAAYQTITLELPADFSTANRSDLSNGDVTLPLTLTVNVQTDEDQDPATDTPTDGTATATRVVDIGFEEDIELTAPLVITGQEDDGNTGDPDLGVTVDLDIDIAITDLDGSETADPSDPRFAASVQITYPGLPAGATFNAGTLTGEVWTGTVAEANALTLSFPGDYNGVLLSPIQVTTPEGTETTLQVIVITPTPDIIIEGDVTVDETDAVLEVLLSDFISILVGGGETILSMTFDLDGLPAGTVVTDGAGTPIGSFTSNPDGTVDYLYQYTGRVFPTNATIFLPQDYSTTSPFQQLFADITVTTNNGTVSESIPFTVTEEGDIDVGDGSFTLTETDAPLTFKPSSQITPVATDIDGSETVELIGVVFNALPTGTRFSTDDGATFQIAPATLNFVGTLIEYNALVIELPADYSTQNPATTLEGLVVAVTNEGGVDQGALTVTVGAEGDLDLTGTGVIQLDENDTPGDSDEDNTTSAPIEFRLTDAVDAMATDADGSESIAEVDVTVNGLPAGALYSTNGGLTFTAVPSGSSFTFDNLTKAQYDGLVFRLPDDFSTTTDITGEVTFTTDEAILANETDVDGTDGIETLSFTVTVISEQDVEIATADITVNEDEGQPIALNLDAQVTDIDGSEMITGITVDFAGLPTNGDTVLSDGTVLSGPSDSWIGPLADLQSLAVASLPQHFSGIIDITVNVSTNEGDPAGTSETFQLNVRPVAEPTLVLSVDSSPDTVDQISADNFIVKEDSSFLLTFDAQTPDRDGSEQLTQIVVENLPDGWVPTNGGTVDPALFVRGAADVASATISGTTLTITLNPGTTVFDGALQVAPLPDDDRDVATIVANDLRATATSEDMAAGLPTDTKTAQDGVNVDVDAVVDGMSVTVADDRTKENTGGQKRINLDLSSVALQDTDGSEVIEKLDLTITVATESDNFDPSDNSQLLVDIADKNLRGYVAITQTGSGANSVTYEIARAPTATSEQFADALEELRITVPQHFSSILTLDGRLYNNETTTGDVETDTTDNFGTTDFRIVETIRPVAEADLTASVFVTDPSFVATDSPDRVEASIEDGSISGSEILTLLESTADGSGPGQVDLFIGLDASTPDTDGSEQLQTLTITNVPTDWIADFLSNSTVTQGAFFELNGGLPLAQSEYDKIASASYDDTTGLLSIAFVADVTSFAASIKLRPSLYEDYDVDRMNGDPFSSLGTFFGDDLQIEILARDDNTAETDDQKSDATFDVDVDPVNNIAVILALPEGNEQVIDDAGGVWQIPFTPVIQDTDGSETVTAVVMKKVPSSVTVYVENPNDPTGDKIPALLTEVNNPPGFNSWSLENGEWQTAELRGIPLHFAGDYPLVIDVVTTEADGGGTRITSLNTVLRVNPVVDGGDPSETASGFEDRPIRVAIDGNIIDNMNNSPGSPEAILGNVVVSNIVPDSKGRVPRFFDGLPQAEPGNANKFVNELLPSGGGNLILSAREAANLWLLPGKDSNETIRFDVSIEYYETIDPSQSTVATGTVTVDVIGIADEPIVTFQNPDPTDDPGAGFTDDQIDDTFRPTEIVDGVANADRVYGYAGKDNAPFLLGSRLRDLVITSGVITPSALFTPADPLTGQMTEMLFGGMLDGSETLYYIITDVDPNVSFLGGTPIDATGESYVVTEAQLATLRFVPSNVNEVTYYDMTLNAIVFEDDQSLAGLIGTPEEILRQIDALPGGSVVSKDFTVVVVPEPGGGPPTPCEPEQELPLPVLSLVGSGDEDTEIPFKLKITPNPPYWDSIDDLWNLPNGVIGDFGLAIDLPPGASLSSDPPGAVLYDPVTGLWVIDIEALGVDPSDPTQTAGSILFTPPEHESSPANPFAPSETFGPDDPYDNLNSLEYQSLLNNFTCNTTSSGSGEFSITINPVVDGPQIILAGGNSFDEDTTYDLKLSISGIDGGERASGKVLIDVDSTNGGQLFDANGNPLSGTDIGGGIVRYEVSVNDLPGLTLTAAEHYSGPLRIRVTANSEDVDGSIGSTTVTRNLEVIPVADVPTFEFDETVIDPETMQPFVDTSGTVPMITAIEDIPFNLSTVLTPDSPDQDGSETISIVLSGVPDYLNVTGPSNNGFIDNGDGSYTISRTAWPLVAVQLKSDHARTPDSLDPTLPAQIPLKVTVNTLELANSDQESGSQDIILKVRPDADVPTLLAEIMPASGTEDDGAIYTINLQGNTPDLHETMHFEIKVPPGGTILLDGVAQPAPGGVVTLSGLAGASASVKQGKVFFPDGTVTYEPPKDFAGMVSLDVVAVTTDADGIFTDTETSPTETLDLDIAVAPDLILDVLDPDVELDETDAPLDYMPAPDFDIQVTDMDGSEVVDNVTYTILGVPDGTTYTVGGGSPVAVMGDLNFSGSEAQFSQLTVTFPRDYATNGTPLDGSIRVTTNEGGDESGSFTIDIDGELDLTVATNVMPQSIAQTGNPITVDFGINAQVTDTQATPSEQLELVVVQFTAPLPAGTTASSGTISGDRLTFARGSLVPADYAALVAALSITLPGDFADDLSGTITVSTNHGDAPAEPFMVEVNDQPDISGPVMVSSTDPVFFITNAELLANASDPDLPLSVENVVADDPLVTVTELAGGVRISVPDAFVGTPTLTYDVVDSGAGPARSQATADLDIDTLQMEANGTHLGPDGVTRDLMDDVTGATGGTDIAKGTANDDAVILTGATDYAEIEGFELQGGSDFIDLSGSAQGFSVDAGSGDDWAIGSGGDDVLTGGAGADTLEGGAGADVFAITDLATSDIILDFEEPTGIIIPMGVDQIDLTTVVALTLGENLSDHVGYNNGTGALTVDGNLAATVETAPGVFASEVEVIFTNAAGAQETAVI